MNAQNECMNGYVTEQPLLAFAKLAYLCQMCIQDDTTKQMKPRVSSCHDILLPVVLAKSAISQPR